MNFLSLFVLIPVLMTCAMFCTSNARTVRTVMMTGASMLLALAVALTVLFLGERASGNTAEMLYTADAVWYAPLNIHYSVGVDGISVAMLLLSAIIVFTGTFVEDGRDAARVFRVVLAAVDRRIRLFYLDRPVHDVPVLRGCADSDVPAHRRMGYGTQGILGHEADADADGRIGPAAGGHFGHPRAGSFR